MKGKDDFFSKKRTFLVTIREVMRKGDAIKFFNHCIKRKVKRYRASDALEIMRKVVEKRNEKRKPDEPEWMVTAVERAPEDS
jgi:hypothetical protein